MFQPLKFKFVSLTVTQSGRGEKKNHLTPFHLLHWAHTESGLERPRACLAVPSWACWPSHLPGENQRRRETLREEERPWRGRQVFGGLEDTRSRVAFCLLGRPPSWQHCTVKPEWIICKSQGIFRKGASRCWENLWAGKLCLGPWWNLGRWEEISLQLDLGHKNAGNDGHRQLARIHSQ